FSPQNSSFCTSSLFGRATVSTCCSSTHILSQKGLCKLLHLLNFIRIMMQAFQQHEHLCWQIYNGSLHIYTICRYLMTMNCSAEALEYLLWASISLELSIPLMTAKCLPWIVTLYCAVCHCYYNNHAAVQAEEFARRALGKINELAKLEEQNEVPATRETQRAYKEASIKLAAMIFKRAVFEARRRHKPIFRIKTKSTLKDIPNVPWPRTSTERMLMGLFDSSAAQFLGILEALWDSTRRPLPSRMPDDPELQEINLELLSAGISILSVLWKSLPIMSAMRFIKMLFQYKQPDAFTELAREMLQVLSVSSTQSSHYSQKGNTLHFLSVLTRVFLCFQFEFNVFSKSNTLLLLHYFCNALLPTLILYVYLVLDVVLFLWGKVKLGIQRDQLHNLEFTHYLEKVDNYDKVAFACDLATVDCIMTAEMIHTLAILLESTAECSNQSAHPGEF
uniref:Cilia and flagella associated protein 54 n=1 Tax=Sander lucioperca TaxID=283035 RepID=A0A8C9YIX1_SANLU